ncbi:unnamed protein product [Ilex paraguariensis]|uniref:Uncharacterized protein n=1 Tax=Ilex paraguariensis TaxID=185542 RepID=A0ABC8T848_9AQUA
MKAKWSDSESKSTLGNDSSSQDDEENFTAFVGPLFSPFGEIATSEVKKSPITKVEDLEEEIPTCVEDEECYEEIQDVKIDLHTPGEKRASPPPIPRPNSSFRNEKQEWETNEDFAKLTISTKLEAPSAYSKVMAPKK